MLSAFALAGILGQLYFALERGWAQGKGTLEILGNFFSYFTILTNSLVVASPWLRRPAANAALAVYILVVGVVYHLLLSGLYQFQGLEWWADKVLHYIVPIGFVGAWALLAEKEPLSWWQPVQWLRYPGAYFAYTLVRGNWTGWYPYPFANVEKLGLAQAVLNGVGVVGFFLVLGVAAVGWTRMKPLSANRLNEQ